MTKFENMKLPSFVRKLKGKTFGEALEIDPNYIFSYLRPNWTNAPEGWNEWCDAEAIARSDNFVARGAVNVTDLAGKCANNSGLRTLEVWNRVWEHRAVSNIGSCPRGTEARYYGIFTDYVVRHLLFCATSLATEQWNDFRAVSVISNVDPDDDEELEEEYQAYIVDNKTRREIKVAYDIACKSRDTQAILDDLYTVSKAHSLFFCRSRHEDTKPTTLDSKWLRSLQTSICDVLEVDDLALATDMILNPTLGHVLPNGGMLQGDGDLLRRGHLYDLKCSRAQTMSKSDKLQLLLYAGLHPDIKKISWVNLCSGDVYTCTFDQKDRVDIIGWAMEHVTP
jgi:hypothetical protein